MQCPAPPVLIPLALSPVAKNRIVIKIFIATLNILLLS